MIFLNELDDMKIYKRNFYPNMKNEGNKNKDNVCLLLTPNYKSSVELLTNNSLVNFKYYRSYYFEKNIVYYINQESYLSKIERRDMEVISESLTNYDVNNIYKITSNRNSIFLENNSMMNISDLYIGYITQTINEGTINDNEVDDLLESLYILSEAIDISLLYENNKSIEIPLQNRKFEIDECIESINEKFSRNVKYRANKLYYNKDNLIKLLIKVNNKDNAINSIYSILSDLVLLLGSGAGLLSIASGEFILAGVGVLLTTALVTKVLRENKNDVNKVARFKSNISNLISNAQYSIKNETNEENKKRLISYYKELNECIDIINVWEKENNIMKENSLITTKEFINKISSDYLIDENCIRILNDDNTESILLNEYYITEDSKMNTNLKKVLYNDRIRKDREVLDMYDKVKIDIPFIDKTYLKLDKYNKYNLINDLSFYHEIFIKNNKFKLDKGINFYYEFLKRLIEDKKYDEYYTNKCIIVPVYDYIKDEDITTLFDYKKDINPITVIFRTLKTNYMKLNVFKDITFIFINKGTYFKVNLANLDDKSIPLLKEKFKKLIINKSENNTIDTNDIEIKSITGKVDDNKKEELVDKINKLNNVEVEEPDTKIDDNKLDTEKINNIINTVYDITKEKEEKISKVRQERLNNLTKEFLNKKILGNETVETKIKKSIERTELPKTSLNIDTIGDEWKNLTFTNFEKEYDIDADILAILKSFSEKSSPLVVRDINIEDTSTSEDYKVTYEVKFENEFGKRFTIKFDVPRMKDHKLMILGGNEKILSSQFVLLPVTKTDNDTVQIVSNYSKIFVRRFGPAGKSYIILDRILKSIKKPESNIKTTLGNTLSVCDKYKLPIDYIDLAVKYSKIENKSYIIYFNIDEMKDKYKGIIKDTNIPIAYDKKNKSIIYITEKDIYSNKILELLSTEKEFTDIYDSSKPSSKYQYSRAKILYAEIPLILIMGYSEGLITAMNKGKIKYKIVEKRPKIDINNQDYIKFNDGYILFDLNYSSSLLMNGLKDCNTEDFSIGDINNKAMYLDFLDNFGGRILADGLDNFYELLLDPKTMEVLKDFKLPTDYVSLLAYANDLLADNHYIKHTDLSNDRYRSNEIISGYVYQSLSKAYGDYLIAMKKNRKDVTMTMKQSDPIDRIMQDPTFSDLSILNPLTEIESINTIGFKGLSGLNSDRSYNLEKRTFDDTMMNTVALSSGFGPNSGITRQAVIDMDIDAKGYLKTDNKKPSITKTFAVTEALTPFGTTRDDTARSAMTFIQTSKHGMRIDKSEPSLVSTGMDMALPYMLTNTYAFKSKKAGKVIDKTDNYLIVEYDDKTKDFIDLRNNVKKNSNGGFFTTIQLSTNLKIGNRFKENEILAYDNLTFSDKVGNTNDLSYNVGHLTKIAILNAEEGYEDSATISTKIAEDMASDVVGCKECILPKDTNILYLVKKGQKVQEGDTLLLFQNAFDEKDANDLIKMLSTDEGEDLNDLGRIPIKSKYTGVIEDIKIYRTVEIDEMSESLQKIVKEYEKPISALRKKIKQNGITEYVSLEPDYKLEPTGKLKNAKESVYIEIYIKYHDNLSVGDKITFFAALKGVIRDFYPEGEEPYSEFRKEEKIHAFLPIASVNKRMVCSIYILGGINKTLIELDRAVKDIAGIPYKYLDQE